MTGTSSGRPGTSFRSFLQMAHLLISTPSCRRPPMTPDCCTVALSLTRMIVRHITYHPIGCDFGAVTSKDAEVESIPEQECWNLSNAQKQKERRHAKELYQQSGVSTDAHDNADAINRKKPGVNLM